MSNIQEIALSELSKALVLFAVIFAVTALGFSVVRRLRRVTDGAADDTSDASKMMSNFRDLHSRGGLSDEEFRTIKTKLAAGLTRKDSEEPGSD